MIDPSASQHRTSPSDRPTPSSGSSSARSPQRRARRIAFALVFSVILGILSALSLSTHTPLLADRTGPDCVMIDSEDPPAHPTSSGEMPFGSIVDLVHRLVQ